MRGREFLHEETEGTERRSEIRNGIFKKGNEGNEDRLAGCREALAGRNVDGNVWIRLVFAGTSSPNCNATAPQLCCSQGNVLARRTFRSGDDAAGTSHPAAHFSARGQVQARSAVLPPRCQIVLRIFLRKRSAHIALTLRLPNRGEHKLVPPPSPREMLSPNSDPPSILAQQSTFGWFCNAKSERHAAPLCFH